VNVGTKALKNRLSHFLRLVREGETVTVMDRNEPVAQIRPIHGARAPGDEQVLRDLERDGLLTRGRGRLRDFAPVRARGRRSLADMVIEDRG
jgi:prevent-host-death family protein